MMKRILITNDDGIRAPGIIRLARAAQAFGEVTVIAPERERSGEAHRITIHEPIDIVPYAFPVSGVTAWICSGTPADCVRTGLARLLPEAPDLVLSGINSGNNVGSDIQYSGTVGAALEAAHQGIPAIAVSEPFGDHTVTDRFLSQILSDLQDASPGKDAIFSVNFPDAPCRGILTGRTVASGSMYQTRYSLSETLPDNGMRLIPDGIPDNIPEDACENGSDFRAVLDHYISIGIVTNVGSIIRE